MDESQAGAAYGPDLRITALSGLGAVVAVGVAALDPDAAGRLLAVAVAAVLLAYTGTDLVYRPRLTLSGDGVQVRAPLTRLAASWPEVTVRADTRRRYGLRSSTLEVDTGERLVVLSRRALGADPDDVAALARRLAPGGGGAVGQWSERRGTDGHDRDDQHGDDRQTGGLG